MKNATQNQTAMVEDRMDGSGQGMLFDYEALDAENRIIVQQRTLEIHDLVRKTAESVVQIGAKLTEVQQRLGGRFTGWLDSEFSWSERTAYNYMAVWQKFGDQKSIAKIANSALYLLSASGTPEPARQAAIEMAEAGEPVTHKVAKTLVAVAKEAEPKTMEMFAEPEALPDSEVAMCICGHRANQHSSGGDCKECVCEDYDEMTPEQYEKAEQDRKALEAAPVPEEPEEPEVSETQPETEAPKPSATPKRDKLVAEKASTDAKKLWGAAAIQINIRLMPVDGDPRGRQAIIAMSADDAFPTISSKRIADLTIEWPPAISELILAFQQKLGEQKTKQAVKPATKKPAAKAAKKVK